MKIKLNSLFAVLFFVAAFVNKGQAQWLENVPGGPPVYYIFDADSLKGFDEEAARKSAIAEHFLGAEFKVRMFQLKRTYINDKYNLWRKPSKEQQSGYFQYEARPTVVPGCTNEDFEASTAGAITTTNQIAGWTVSSGYNGYVAAGNTSTLGQYYPNGLTNANSCNQLGCCPMPPTECELITAPTGYIDPVITNVYPIFSVFGTAAGNPNGPANNPQITQGMFGNSFIRINSNNNNYSMAKLSKTFSVTPQNALFQFAFISVFSTGHGCCDAGAFQIKLSQFNGPNNPPTPITCPSFSASALSAACTNTATNITFLNAGSGSPATTSSGLIFNKWQLASMDLSSYIGQNITIDVVTSDCTAGGHYGYVYFDAQCAPMTVYGNGTPYAAGSGTVTVPTCGAAGATICAAAGLGPYSWAGPNVPPNMAVPSLTNSCFTTSISATYTLSMNPAGACAPITRIVASTITPAPTLNAGVLQATCGNTLAIVTITPGGSAANPANVTWSPPPILNTPTTQGQYAIPTGSTPILVTISATDPIGCLVTTTANVLPAAPFPTFAIVNLGTNQQITCANPVVNMNAVSNYSYNGNSLNYFWVGTNATYSAANAPIALPGNFTVSAVDPITNCSATQTISITSNTVKPTAIVSPTFQNITCGVSPNNVTVTATSPTVNVTHMIFDPLGGSYSVTNTQALYGPGTPGAYTVITVNEANGCTVVKTFSVFSNTGFPTFSVNSAPGGFTLGCAAKATITLNIVGATTTSVDPTTSVQVSTGGACSYTLLSPSSPTTTPGGTLSSISNYSINTPGTWTVVTKDNVSLCETRIPVSVISNTVKPPLDTLLIPRDILDCTNPTVTLRGVSNNSIVTYVWSYDGTVGNLAANTITVGANFTVAPTNTVVDQYTLTLKDNNNLCTSSTVVPIYQNLFPPKAVISNGGVLALSCKVPTVMLTNSSSSNIPPNGPKFPTGAPVIGLRWKGPSPQVDGENASTYVGSIPGTYTMIAKDLGNGCTSQTVMTIIDNFEYPIVNNPVVPPPTILDCGKGGTIKPIYSGSKSVLTYSWSAPADDIATSPKNRDTLYTDREGEYKLVVTNTVSGCISEVDMKVIANNSITTNFTTDVTQGFAPLTVNFVNTSSTANGTANIASVWNFGNGSSATATAVPTATALFKQPGNYTVTLYAAKGSCQGSVQKVISVDLPSSLTVPNVFTPNGDGINDFFFLKVTGMAEITITIFDRWGHKTYDLTTTKGNISWDGLNQLGKEAPDGTYFYVLKSKGKDGKEYDQKGTISLFR